MHTQLSHFAALRRNKRTAARIPTYVETTRSNLRCDTVTMNVSLTGAFLLDEEGVFEVGEQLHVRLWLPDSLEFVHFTAQVMRRGKLDDKDGVGVAYMLQESRLENYEKWEGFMERLMEREERRTRELTGVERPVGDVEYTWQGLTLDAIDELLHVDVFIGGVFVETAASCEVGTKLMLVLMHPIDGSRMRIAARVTGCRTSGVSGLCVEFCEPAQPLSQRIQAFIEEGMPKLYVNEVLFQRASQELRRVG